MKNTTRIFRQTFHAPTYQAHPACEDYILFMGRLSDEKGVEVLLNAMKLVPEAKLKVVGRGPHEQSLKELAQTLELKNVDFAGSIWGDAAKDQIRTALCSFTFVVARKFFVRYYRNICTWQSFAWKRYRRHTGKYYSKQNRKCLSGTRPH
ncbi:MAG: glycosyltransferase family 4 protein [Bacteroidetes bacterium]|nr:glycosyltransferase family 4 protein [Bacteroidota bacterium]